MIKFLKKRVKRSLQILKVLACLDLGDYFLLYLLDVAVQRVEVGADLALDPLLEGVRLELLNLIEVLH